MSLLNKIFSKLTPSSYFVLMLLLLSFFWFGPTTETELRFRTLKIESSQIYISSSTRNRNWIEPVENQEFGNPRYNLWFEVKFKVPVEFQDSKLEIVSANEYNKKGDMEIPFEDVKLLQLSEARFLRNQERAEEDGTVVNETILGFSVALGAVQTPKQFEIFIVAKACSSEKCIPLAGRFLVESYEEETWMFKARKITNTMMSV